MNTDVRYYNFSTSNRFQKDYGSFVDADRLNYERTIKFIDILMEEIRELGTDM